MRITNKPLRETGKPQSEVIRKRALAALDELGENLEGHQLHWLKTINTEESPSFDWVWRDRKPAELRFNDRNFRAWDVLVLEEYPYTGRFSVSRVLSVVDYSAALSSGWVMLPMQVIVHCDNIGMSAQGKVMTNIDWIQLMGSEAIAQ